MEQLLREAEQLQSLFPDLTEEEKRAGKERLKTMIQVIERDLYGSKLE
jgi:hypothetical protein